MPTRSLSKTQLFREDPELAQRLWDEGFREKPIMKVEVGEVLAYHASMFGFPFGDIKFATITEVKIQLDAPPEEEYGVWVDHNGPERGDWADELTPVWTRPGKDKFNGFRGRRPAMDRSM